MKGQRGSMVKLLSCMACVLVMSISKRAFGDFHVDWLVMSQAGCVVATPYCMTL